MEEGAERVAEVRKIKMRADHVPQELIRCPKKKLIRCLLCIQDFTSLTQ